MNNPKKGISIAVKDRVGNRSLAEKIDIVIN